MRYAFSLVELSIVLVILGLLTGGILTGQSLIRAAELRSITTEFNTYQTAVMTFKDKYFALPGDMTNATDFWNSAGGDGLITTSACYSVATGNNGTCSGNGDTVIGTADNHGSNVERFSFWQHLSLAELIQGEFAAVGSGISYGHQAGYNAPASKLDTAIWSIIKIDDASNLNASQYYNGIMPTVLNGSHHFVFGTSYQPVGTYYSAPAQPALPPEEAWGIDTKLDDGMPYTGKIISTARSTSASLYCTTDDDVTVVSAEYRLTSSDVACALLFDAGF